MSDISLRIKLRAGIEPAGNIDIIENGEYSIKDYATAVVDVQPELQSKTATPTKTEQTITPDTGKDGLSDVVVEAIPEEYITPTGTQEITENGTYNVKEKAEAVVDVQPELQSKTATPTKAQQTITPDAGKDGLSDVIVEAIPEEYITPTGTQEITENGTYNVKEKAEAVVDVQPEVEITKALTPIKYYDDRIPSIAGSVLTLITMKAPKVSGWGSILYSVSPGQVIKVNAGVLQYPYESLSQQPCVFFANSTQDEMRFLVVESHGAGETYEGEAFTTPEDASFLILCGYGIDATLEATETQSISDEIELHTHYLPRTEESQVVEPEGIGDAITILTGENVDHLEEFLTEPTEGQIFSSNLKYMRSAALARTAYVQYDLPLLETAGDSLFFHAGGRVIRLPEYRGGRSDFESSKFSEIYLPKFNPDVVQSTFIFCTSLKKVRMPALDGQKQFATPFNGATAIQSIDIGFAVPSNSSGMFSKQSQLKLLCCRADTPLECFSFNTHSPIRGGTGYLLFPGEMIDIMVQATDWVALYEAGTKFLAVEDYTQDGTLTGELDEDKIDSLIGS